MNLRGLGRLGVFGSGLSGFLGVPTPSFGNKFAGLNALKTFPTLGRELLLRFSVGGAGSRGVGVPDLWSRGGNEPSLPAGGNEGGRPWRDTGRSSSLAGG